MFHVEHFPNVAPVPRALPLPVRTDELDFELPKELIAQRPAARRDESRLMHYDRATGGVGHRTFADLPALLRAGDVLVFNDARVTPARFALLKPTGGRVGGLFLARPTPGEWHALLKSPGPVRPDLIYRFAGHATAVARVVEKLGGGRYRLLVDGPDADVLLGEIGTLPLPPYIRGGREEADDRERYQTVYAAAPGSVAAPTAGLHFTPELLDRLDAAGVIRATVTLHVGLGTFRPVLVDALDDHPMHAERYELPAATADVLNAAERDGRRVVAVGTTSVRVLESHPPGEPFAAGGGETRIFLRPPYQWRHVGAMLTNFHLPRSTLLALVAAFVGLDAQRRLYAEAVAERYRFFSYGDAMLLE